MELGCLLCWFATAAVTAQQSESAPLVASLLAPTAPSEIFRTNLRAPIDPLAIRLTERLDGGLIAPRRALTAGEAWEKFEADYRPQQPSSSLVKRQLESAKYQLDTAAFGFDRFVRNIEDNSLFKLD